MISNNSIYQRQIIKKINLQTRKSIRLINQLCSLRPPVPHATVRSWDRNHIHATTNLGN